MEIVSADKLALEAYTIVIILVLKNQAKFSYLPTHNMNYLWPISHLVSFAVLLFHAKLVNGLRTLPCPPYIYDKQTCTGFACWTLNMLVYLLSISIQHTLG